MPPLLHGTEKTTPFRGQFLSSRVLFIFNKILSFVKEIFKEGEGEGGGRALHKWEMLRKTSTIESHLNLLRVAKFYMKISINL